MKLLTVPDITYKQKEILDLIYSHRFLTRVQIQTFLKHKDKKTINLWLKDLRAKDYINWIYDGDDFYGKTKPAIYYLNSNGIRYFGNLELHSDGELCKRYREHERSQAFIDHSLLIADCCLSLEAAKHEEGWPNTWYFYETEGTYRSDSYYHFLAESELVQPDLCFSKDQYGGGSEPEVVESYLLEIFDATLPRYRLRNRLKNYVTYLDEETSDWEDGTYGDPLPTILLVCANLTDLIYAKRRTRGLLADIWDYDEEERPHIRFTTTDKLKDHGVLVEEIWEGA